MGELCAYDVDGTVREGSLLGDLIVHGIELDIVDPALFEDPQYPVYADADTFVAAITGHSRRLFQELTDRISDEAPQHTMDWAHERLTAQQAAGQHRVLISHAPDFAVRAFARGIDVNHAYGSYFHTREHVFSGHTALRDKVKAMQRYSRQHNLDVYAFAAGDTFNDVPMLTAAESAAVINPAPALGELALQRGWEIIRTNT